MMCQQCGGGLREVDTYEGERSFTLYECRNCGKTGGRATGGELPEETWGICGEPLAADGGSEGEEVGGALE